MQRVQPLKSMHVHSRSEVCFPVLLLNEQPATGTKCDFSTATLPLFLMIIILLMMETPFTSAMSAFQVSNVESECNKTHSSSAGSDSER